MKSCAVNGCLYGFNVTPRAGVWIEIMQGVLHPVIHTVTPRAGVWIEINIGVDFKKKDGVTPRAGVWIEISRLSPNCCKRKSLPVRECGLKSCVIFIA